MEQYGVDQISRVMHEGSTLTVILQRTAIGFQDTWACTDAAGHRHTAGIPGDSYPTLSRVHEGWAAGPDEGEDDDSDLERYHLACRMCGEKIWPSEYGPQVIYLPGVCDYEIDGVSVDEEDAREFIGQVLLDDPDRWGRLYGWLKYATKLLPRGERTRMKVQSTE
jgi:hypothetical protein